MCPLYGVQNGPGARERQPDPIRGRDHYLMGKDGPCAQNKSLNDALTRFWATFDAMIDELKAYCALPIAVSPSTPTPIQKAINFLVKVNLSAWLNGKIGVSYTELDNLFKRKPAKGKKLLCDRESTYRSILLYTLYEKDSNSFNQLIQSPAVLPALPDKITKYWVEAIRSNCSLAAMTTSRQHVMDFMDKVNSSITFELTNQMYLSPVYLLPTGQEDGFLNDEVVCLLRTLLRYWQYEAVVTLHATCCRELIKTYGDRVIRSLFLIIREKLPLYALKSMHPHMWMILADMAQKYPMVVLEGCDENTVLPLISTLPEKLTAIAKSLQASNRYSGELLFGRVMPSDPATRFVFCTVLSDGRMRALKNRLQTQITLDNVIVAFQKRYLPSLGLRRAAMLNRGTVNVDNIAYYRFFDSALTWSSSGNLLYSLNVLDKPLPALRSRFEETSGRMNIIVGGNRSLVMATSRCGAFFLPRPRAIISRQILTKIVNNDMVLPHSSTAHFNLVNSAKLMANVDVVSALMCDRYPVLKNTLMVSLSNSYEPKVNVLDENKYLFIRANMLKNFASAFPPSLSALDDQSRFIDKLRNLTQTGHDALANWSRVYAMGEALLVRSCDFIGDRWNALAKNNPIYKPKDSEKDKLVLLWQFLGLRWVTDLYNEYNLIFGSLQCCDDPGLAEKSRQRVGELQIPWQLAMVRLTCINFLLSRWTPGNEIPSPAKGIMDVFELRHEGIAALFKRHGINIIRDFYSCYPNSDDNLRQFSTSTCYGLFDAALVSKESDVAAVQFVPLCGYSSVFSMKGLMVITGNEQQAEANSYNGSAKFDIPIKDGWATAKLVERSSKTLLFKLEVLSTDALFVSLIVTPVNANHRSANGTDRNIEYKIKVQIGQRITPIDSETKRAIVSFSARPITTRDNSAFYNEILNLSAESRHRQTTLPAAKLLVMNRTKRIRMPLSLSAEASYYEVPSLDEMELNDSHRRHVGASSLAKSNQGNLDTSLISFSAARFIQTAPTMPAKLANMDEEAEGIYFVLGGERLSLPV